MFPGLTDNGRKWLLPLLSFGLVMMALVSPGRTSAAHAGLYVSYGAYESDYEYLDDYGEWIYVPPYGHVWHPYVVASWQPFFHGHWVWTNWGWTWVSYEPFGWLVYHYGYWDWRPRIGWIWIPGTRWSPARVRWMIYGDFCAWTPMPPPRAYWPDPWESWHVDVWIVVEGRHFTDDHVGRYHVSKPVFREISRRDVLRRAPSVERIERIIHRSIPKVTIEREEKEIRPVATRRPPRPGQPIGTRLRAIELPESEKSRVREYAPKVESEVLQQKPAQQRREIQTPQREREKQEVREKQKPTRKTIRR